ncbi:MAG: hypothetical protein Ct9H300mP14_09250 [Gammaproteobacteria bacterium]|nr:MAG: hypothetical protein Ct9H300mP14_09250 [Gammaproteobacteria bacterium]
MQKPGVSFDAVLGRGDPVPLCIQPLPLLRSQPSGTYEPDTPDARNLLCPKPVIRTQDRVKALNTGDILEVQCTDPGALNDIPGPVSRSRPRSDGD